MKMIKNDPKLDLPFDQYSRQIIVRELIDSLRLGDQHFEILDVGGYKGKTAEFLSLDHVTVLDVEDVSIPNYVKGDGTKLSFDAGRFDFVCSFDVLEHIPPAQREKFIRESLRVAKYGVFLACPFDNISKHTRTFEMALNEVYKKVHNSDHRWLKEHIDNTLPTQKEIETAVKANGASAYNLYTNNLYDWSILQECIFLASALDEPSFDVGRLNRYYNENIKKLESGLNENNAYRTIYFISRDNKLIQKTRAFADKKFKKEYNHAAHNEMTFKAFETIAAIQNQNKSHYKTMIKNIKKEAEYLRKIISEIESSSSWKLTKPLRSVNAHIHKHPESK